MYSDKKNVLQLVALLKAHHIKNIVLCPGSRNAPLVHTLSTHPDFICHSVVDERSAGFIALGMALNGGQTTAVCCTSGTALLNLHPAVAEAFYQQVPLVVISADRPLAWIGQMDGQTLPQNGLFQSIVKMSVNLPQVHNEEEEWFCNRLINEALLETRHHGRGPVHINIPLSEPLFNWTTEKIPEVRVITRYQGLNLYDKDYNQLIERLNSYHKRMMLVGQMNLIYLFDKNCSKSLYKHFAWVSEHMANQTIPGWSIKNMDTTLATLTDEQRLEMTPELLITYGGHTVSKRVKRYFRKYPPKEHWHVASDGKVVDLFGKLTTVIEMDPFEFLEKIATLVNGKTLQYPQRWEQLSAAVPQPQFQYSAMYAVGELFKNLPDNSTLHLANSSAVRYAQFYPLLPTIEVCCNRGTSGIEGSLSTALGYAVNSEKLNFIVIGDLSFFYDMNALCFNGISHNVRILLLNNGGGGIFHTLPDLEMSGTSHKYITAVHKLSAKEWAESRGLHYHKVDNEEQLQEVMPQFVSSEVAHGPMILEVFTNKNRDARILKEYYKSLKK